MMTQEARHKRIEKLLTMSVVALMRLYHTPRPPRSKVPHQKPGALLRAAARIRAGMCGDVALAEAEALEQAARWEKRALWTERKLQWINSILQPLYQEEDQYRREAELAAFHGAKRMAKRGTGRSVAESLQIMNRGLRGRTRRRGKKEIDPILAQVNSQVRSMRRFCRFEGLEHFAPDWAIEAPTLTMDEVLAALGIAPGDDGEYSM
jgi:hypothetical protein